MTDFYLAVGFGLFVITMLVLDLAVFHRKAHTVSIREAAIWTCVWVSLALIFNAIVYVEKGGVAGLHFLTGYLIEWTLSMDNVFVFALIFSYFAVPPKYQHRVLFWGILGAVVMRFTFILAGTVLLERFHWLLYVMGAFLLLTGVRLLFERHKEVDVGEKWIVRVARRLLPITPGYVDQRFFTRIEGRLFVTPLFLVLLVVETTDVVFAVDSIPAIFGITRDPFIIFTSNIFAILGLRALYFLLAGAMDKFRYLNIGLAAILCFIGVKMLFLDAHEASPPAGVAVILGCVAGAASGVEGPVDMTMPLVSLGVVVTILSIAVAASMIVTRAELRRLRARNRPEDGPAASPAEPDRALQESELERE